MLSSVHSRLWKIYPDDEDLKKFCLNYMCYYSTMPWISPLVIGTALGTEDEGGTSSLDTVNDLKVGLMELLAGIGDTIDWAMVSTIFGSTAASMGMEGSLLRIFLWATFTFVFLVVRIFRCERGYGMGVNVITKFGKQMTAFIEACSVLSLTTVGSLAATVIRLSTDLQFKNGDVAMKVQELIDGVMPVSLPVATVGIIYYLMEVRRTKMTWVILFIVVAFTVRAATDIFTV